MFCRQTSLPKVDDAIGGLHVLLLTTISKAVHPGREMRREGPGLDRTE